MRRNCRVVPVSSYRMFAFERFGKTRRGSALTSAWGNSMTMRWTRALGWLTLALAPAQVWGGVQLQSFGIDPGPGPQLFNTVGAQGAPGSDAGPGASVAWPVTVNTALLNTLPASIQVNFPDRPSVTLTRTRSERRGSGFLWAGRNNDCSGLFRQAPSGFKGMLSCGNAPYGVDHAVGSSNLRLSRYDNAGGAVNDDIPAIPPPGSIPSGFVPTPPMVDQTVDVLVLFNSTLTVNRWEFAQDVVDQIRQAMDNSTTSGQSLIADIRLAGAARISRSPCDAIPDDLAVLPTDPQVTALRNYWAADVIIYITCGGPPLLGQAYIPGYQTPPPGPKFAPVALAVALSGYAINPGDFVADHEFAHTFGANHNPDHEPRNPTPIEPWAFGHWARHLDGDVAYGLRSIMSYPQECEAVVNPCPRILYYSNPNVIVDDWFHTGIANQQENARLIAEIAPIQAQYRASVGRIFADGFE